MDPAHRHCRAKMPRKYDPPISYPTFLVTRQQWVGIEISLYPLVAETRDPAWWLATEPRWLAREHQKSGYKWVERSKMIPKRQVPPWLPPTHPPPHPG